MAPFPVTGALISTLGLFGHFANAQTCSTTCQSYGVDYVNGGAYFQNVASTADFTALEDFNGCQNDTATNVLVNPAGVQYKCNSVPIVPNLTPQLVTCPLRQNQMYSGNWSMIVISNNGDCAPIDNVRSFSLSVGTQTTTTVAPTITLTTTTTPVVGRTRTVTRTYTSTAKPSVSTVSQAPSTTYTYHPQATFLITTRGVITQTRYSQIPSVVGTTTVTTTEGCAGGFSAAHVRVADAVNTRISVTVAHGQTRATQHAHARAADQEADSLLDTSTPSRAMRQKRALVRRHPDPPTQTVTGSNLSTVTSTSTRTAPATTITGTTTVVSLTVTTPTITVSSGGGGATTVTAQQLTITDILWIPVAYTTKTITTDVTVTATHTVQPTVC